MLDPNLPPTSELHLKADQGAGRIEKYLKKADQVHKEGTVVVNSTEIWQMPLSIILGTIFFPTVSPSCGDWTAIVNRLNECAQGLGGSNSDLLSPCLFDSSKIFERLE